MSNRASPDRILPNLPEAPTCIRIFVQESWFRSCGLASGFRILILDFGSRFLVQDVEVWVEGLGVEGLGFGVQGSAFRVHGFCNTRISLGFGGIQFAQSSGTTTPTLLDAIHPLPGTKLSLSWTAVFVICSAGFRMSTREIAKLRSRKKVEVRRGGEPLASV